MPDLGLYVNGLLLKHSFPPYSFVLNKMFGRFRHTLVCSCSSFVFVAVLYSVVCTCSTPPFVPLMDPDFGSRDGDALVLACECTWLRVSLGHKLGVELLAHRLCVSSTLLDKWVYKSSCFSMSLSEWFAIPYHLFTTLICRCHPSPVCS